ncbi:MAG: hypothetical protein AAGA30_19985 [Planctomycetota bacterium]
MSSVRSLAFVCWLEIIPLIWTWFVELDVDIWRFSEEPVVEFIDRIFAML